MNLLEWRGLLLCFASCWNRHLGEVAYTGTQDAPLLNE